MGLIKLLFGNRHDSNIVEPSHKYTPLPRGNIEEALKNVWRSADGSYSNIDKDLMEKYLGIINLGNELIIHNSEVKKDIKLADFPGCNIIYSGGVSSDFTRFLYSLSSKHGLWHNEISLVSDGIEHNTFKTNQVKLFNGKYKYFYFTISNGKRSQIALKYLNENYDLCYLDNEFDDDDTINVVVRESIKNESKYFFLDFLETAKTLSIYGIPAATILSVVENSLSFQSEMHYNPDAYPEEKIQLCQRIFNMIKTKHHFTDNETAQYIYDYYYIEDDGSTYFESRIVQERTQYSECYNKYGDKWHDIYDEFFKRLVLEDGYKTKWVSELSLYKMVAREYPDAIYQYSAAFLQGQSLDIFIPSKNIAIEYQGIQHYKPVPLFGGEEGFTATQRRDQRKKEKLSQNGINLIEWKYNEPISKVLLKQKIQDLSVCAE